MNRTPTDGRNERDRLWLFEMSRDQFRHLEHAHLTFAVENFPQRFVGIDHGSLFLILATVLLNVGPQLFGYLRARKRFGTDNCGKLCVGLDWPHKRGVRLSFRSCFWHGLRLIFCSRHSNQIRSQNGCANFEYGSSNLLSLRQHSSMFKMTRS
jgi:hypothetical protein